MDVIESNVPGVLIIEPKLFGDHRGFFLETFQIERYASDASIDRSFKTIFRAQRTELCADSTSKTRFRRAS